MKIDSAAFEGFIDGDRHTEALNAMTPMELSGLMGYLKIYMARSGLYSIAEIKEIFTPPSLENFLRTKDPRRVAIVIACLRAYIG